MLPWQSAFLIGYLGNRVQLREIAMDDLEDALGIGLPEDAEQ